MGNLLNTLKKFVANKNTVTIIGVLAGVIVLYVGYNCRINQSVATIQVYYVNQAVESNTQLTEDMISRVTVNAKLTNTYKNLVTNLSQIQDANGEFFYVNFDHSLTEGQLLCTSDLIAKSEKADQKLYKNLKKDYKIFMLDVDLDTTHGNSIAPGNAVDIYIQGKDENKKIIFTPFIENLEVIDVVDTKWSTTAGEEGTSPKYIITVVSVENFELLTKATLLNDYSFELIPVPKEVPFSETDGETKIVNEYLKNLIEANSAYTGS